ncbi:hypothetical protein [Streptomyces sp. TRM68416]
MTSRSALLIRFLDQLHHCLKTRQQFDEQRACTPLAGRSCRRGGRCSPR